MTHTGLGKGVRAHVSDASFHARSMHRSLTLAAEQAQTPKGEHKLSQLAREARRWAIELDPKTHWRRERCR